MLDYNDLSKQIDRYFSSKSKEDIIQDLIETGAYKYIVNDDNEFYFDTKTTNIYHGYTLTHKTEDNKYEEMRQNKLKNQKDITHMNNLIIEDALDIINKLRKE